MKWADEMVTRLKSETPIFFKKLRTAALSLGGSCLAVVAIAPTVHFDNHLILAACKYTIVACAFVAGTTQLTSTKPPANG